MKKGGRSSAVCNLGEHRDVLGAHLIFLALNLPNLDFPQKIERLKAELHLLDAAGSGPRRHLFFVDTEREGEAATATAPSVTSKWALKKRKRKG